MVSDEIHADIIYDGGKHIPLASLGGDIAARTVTITSATKGFNIPALRCAALHFGAPALRERFFARLPARLLGSPSVTGTDATVAAWDHGQAWFNEILGRLRTNRDWLAHTVAQALPGVVIRLPRRPTWPGSIAPRSIWVCQPGKFFLERARVGLNSGEAFGERYGAFCRLNFATSPAILEQVLGRMAEAVAAALNRISPAPRARGVEKCRADPSGRPSA